MPTNDQPAFGDQTRKANARSGMNAERLVDNGFKVREAFCGFVSRYRIVLMTKCFIELLMKSRLGLRVTRKIVCDSTRGTSILSAKNIGTNHHPYFEVVSDPAMS